MSFAVVAAAGGAIAGGLIASSGAKSAAKTQAQAATDASAVNKQMFDEQNALQAPFRENGLAANNRLAFLLGLGGNRGAPAGGQSPGLSPTQSFGGLSPQMLSQGSDGVFAPGGGVESADAIRARLAGQFTTAGENPRTGHFNGSTYVPDPTTPGTVDEAGLNAAIQAEMQRQQATQAQQPQAGQSPAAPVGNDFSSAGSLNQNFGQADFAADGAPKFGPFDQQVPTATPYGNFTDNTNLAGFQDLPAFNPDMLKEDPGYQFRLDQGMKGVNNSAAARGGLLSGAALKAAGEYNQNYASGEYGNAFNRYQTTRGNNLQDYLTNQNTDQLNRSNALSDYTTNQNTAQQNFANANTAYANNLSQYSLNRGNALQDYNAAYDRFQTNRANVINPLLSLSGAGQQATNQTGQAAQSYGQQAGNALMAAGNASAAGQVGSANAINGSIGSAIGMYNNNALMNRLFPPTGATGASTSATSGPAFYIGQP